MDTQRKRKATLHVQLAISARELAEKMSLSTRTVWRLLSSGKLPQPCALGGSKRWKISDIDLFFACDCDMDAFKARKEAEDAN